ncbi:MAG: hypothetical protein IJ120_01480 [Solobacterium sp.]|nr:hypothetical protein [Solobacterium sp.]
MELRVRLKQYDLISGTQTVVTDSTGFLDGDVLTYWEDDAHRIRHEVAFSEERITLKRAADTKSFTVLPKEGTGRASVVSEYGTMWFDTKLYLSRKDEDSWEAEYGILQDADVLTHQRLVWELRGLADERD